MNRIAFFFSVFWGFCVSLYAQNNYDFTKRLEKALNKQSIVEKALDGSIVVLNQYYQVKNKKTGKVYGRGGRTEFGNQYFVGVKTKYGIVISNEAISPWLLDNDYSKIASEYDPVVSLSEIRVISQKEKTDFSKYPLHMSQHHPVGIWIANDSDSNDTLVDIDTEGSIKEGNLIWLISQNKLDADKKATITIQSVSKSFCVNPDSVEFEIDSPINDGHILGGIFVCPHFIGGGRIIYKLVGMIVKDNDKWKLRTPFIGYSFEKNDVVQQETSKDESQVEEPAQEKDDQDIDLTPVEQPKDKKKGKKSKK